jgi:predicted membrane channel-forming protein YqfA (hemolysin III family)
MKTVDKSQQIQGIGLMLVGLGSILTILSSTQNLSTYFLIIGVILFIIGAFFFGKSVTIRRKMKKH